MCATHHGKLRRGFPGSEALLEIVDSSKYLSKLNTSHHIQIDVVNKYGRTYSYTQDLPYKCVFWELVHTSRELNSQLLSVYCPLLLFPVSVNFPGQEPKTTVLVGYEGSDIEFACSCNDDSVPTEKFWVDMLHCTQLYHRPSGNVIKITV